MTFGLVLIAITVASVVFFALYRRWHLRWGATEEDLDRTIPGDEVVPAPTFNATRVVTVGAEPDAIWPWIVQIGFGRAGWYTYDLLDNLGRPSAERIVPELQRMEVGQLVPMGPGKDAGMRVGRFEEGRWMVWWDKHRTTTWAWSLHSIADGSTLLLTRVRAGASWRHPTTVLWLLLFEVADFPLMRKCLLGIKRRAEGGPTITDPDTLARGGTGGTPRR